MWQWLAMGNIQQRSYIPQVEQHSFFMQGSLSSEYVTITYKCMAYQSSHIALFIVGLRLKTHSGSPLKYYQLIFCKLR